MSNITEERKIIKKAAAGNADAFEQLLLKYQTPIYNLCLRITGNQEDAADMTPVSYTHLTLPTKA